jgi:uncharacterized protein YkwD
MFRGVRAILSLAAALALLAAFLPGSAPASGNGRSTAARAATTLDLGVLDQLNQIRAAHRLTALSPSPTLGAAAQTHSREMLVNGYFGHDSSNGSPFWKRIRAYYPEGRYGYWSVGENLFWSSGSTSATAAMKAWMASPEHRANILDPAWRQIGVAAVSSRNAPGTYEGRGVTVITTDFGVRR